MSTLKYQLVRAMPRRAVTRLAGRAAAWTLPTPLREPIYRTFANAVGARTHEADQDLESYASFDAFFTRRLRLGLRPWNAAPNEIAMPCDGRLDQLGRTQGGRLIQAKGIDYRAESLLGSALSLPWVQDAWFATIYLSPADYHRVHAPCDGRYTAVRRIGGELWPVNGISVPRVDGLFVINERVAAEFDLRDGRKAAMVMVAATVVGGIELAAALPAVPRSGDEWRVNPVDPPVLLRAGEEFGVFHLGSTVVLLVEDGRGELEPHASAALGSTVTLGQPLLVAPGRPDPVAPTRRRGRAAD